MHNVEINGDRSLTLRYVPNNDIPLASSHKEVLKHLHRLWGFTVTLEQKNEDASVTVLASCPEAAKPK